MKKTLLRNTFGFVLMLFCGQLFSQTQTIRGKIIDKETQQPIAEATVSLVSDSFNKINSVTNEAGEYKLEKVPVGRHEIYITHIGYKPGVAGNIIVTSAKEVLLDFELQQLPLEISNVVIKAKPRKGQVNNEAGLISSRLFTVEETDRYAGSRGDPARMASNFAGVQGANDSRNDIVVRGNSPGGVLWRLEGIDIPNPNHFAIPGTTGGPISIINNKILANSDFFTGAFPAEYGNSTAGVFDLKMRKGNDSKYEHSSQLGLFGWDFSSEGPLSKSKKSSYLVSYRYSTLAIFSALKIPLGTDAVPKYQDASFKLNFPINNKASFSLFGLGGTSNINILISDQTESSEELYGDEDRDQNFKTKMGIFGAGFQYNPGKKTRWKATFSMSSQQMNSIHHLVFRHHKDTFIRDGKQAYHYQLDSLVHNQDYEFKTSTAGIHLFGNTNISKKTTLKYGAQFTQYFYNFYDSSRNFDTSDKAKYWKYFLRWNSEGRSTLMQPYVQALFKINSRLTMSLGLHSQISSLNDKNRSNKKYKNTIPIEPRFGLNYLLTPTSTLNMGLGMHSQMQQAYTYYYILPGNNSPHNLGMKPSRSNHLVLGYNKQINKNVRFKFETYYQQLYNIPVTIKPSSFSLANTGSGFSRFFPDSLNNEGTGTNYGFEFTLEKFFSNGYYYMTTLSLYDAKYKGSDGITRNSDFNTRYTFNALFAKEFVFDKRKSLNVGAKATFIGARYFSPIDTLNSIKQREYIENDKLKNSKTFDNPYSRIDLRISYKINSKKLTHEFALDLVNIFNHKNILNYTYTTDPPYYRLEYQLGFLPVFYYKLDF